MTFRIKHLDPVVAPVGDVYITMFINRHACGPVELSLATAGRADYVFQFSLTGEYLESVVTPVRYINITALINMHSQGRSICPGSEPWAPNPPIYSPSGVYCWIRWFLESTTIRFPSVLKAIPVGPSKLTLSVTRPYPILIGIPQLH